MKKQTIVQQAVYSGVLCVLVLSSLGERVVVNMPAEELPPARAGGDMSVEEAIAARRSVRRFTDEPLSTEQIGQLLWSLQGITAKNGRFRAAPSAGATYPLKVYVALPNRVVRYEPASHSVVQTVEGDQREALAEAAHGQRSVANAPAVFVLTAIPERTTQRYGERGVTYVHMEAGHAAQNLHLQAVALGLGSVPIGAFGGGELRKALGFGKDEEVLYMLPVGKPAVR